MEACFIVKRYLCPSVNAIGVYGPGSPHEFTLAIYHSHVLA
jgi:hypothetical protein